MTQTQPIFILPEGYQRTLGRDAQRNNIAAAKQVAETVRTTLGPKGMDKMIVDSMGNITVTNDGVTILEEMAPSSNTSSPESWLFSDASAWLSSFVVKTSRADWMSSSVTFFTLPVYPPLMAVVDSP